MAMGRLSTLSLLIISSLAILNAQVRGSILVNHTVLKSAVLEGAVCLDGSPPVYSYVEGTGNGSNSWVVFMEGGAWCISKSDCVSRSKIFLGSSNKFQNDFYLFSGILDTNCSLNADFCNWHKVFIHYCDGSLYLSDIEQVDQGANLTFRGGRIYKVMMEEMLRKGMGKAENAILTGYSAGGLSTILHCDKFRSLLPITSRVKYVSDSGFFIRGKGPLANFTERLFANVVATHELANYLPTSCTSKRDPNLCLFPEYLVGDVSTPIFLVESAFDLYQIQSHLAPAVGGSNDVGWRNCTVKNIQLCNTTQLGIIKDFSTTFIETLMKLEKSSSRGMFVDSCYLHTRIEGNSGWRCSSILANKTIEQAVSHWFYDRGSFQEIDTHSALPRNCTSSKIDDETCVAQIAPPSHDGF